MLEALMLQLDKRTDSATIDRFLKSLEHFKTIYPDSERGISKTMKLLKRLQDDVESSKQY